MVAIRQHSMTDKGTTETADLDIYEEWDDMTEVFKLLTNNNDDNKVHLDMNTDTRTRRHSKKLVVKRCLELFILQ